MHHTVKTSTWFALVVALYCVVTFNPLSANQITLSQAAPKNLDAMWGNDNAVDAPVGSGVLKLQGNDINTDALLMRTEIELNVNGLLADMTLQQQFSNTSNQWLEGIYLFPLPTDAAVHGMTIQVGERIIKGDIKTRDQARKNYQIAKQSGQVASLVEQQRPNMFTARVANIAPGDIIKVRLDIMLPIHFRDAYFQLLLPTTYTPRYVNAATPDAVNVSGPVAHDDRIHGSVLSLKARIQPVATTSLITSPSHSLEYSDSGITLSGAPMDRDLILQWPASSTLSPLANVFTTEFAGQRYMQLMLPPPNDLTATNRGSRELILIVDKSGSMAGEPLRAAKRAVLSALQGLELFDYFNIIAFDSAAVTLFEQARIADQKNINSAMQFIRRLSADGGTEMEQAIRFALKSNNPDRLRQLVFVTDGSVAYEDTLLRMIKRNIGNNRLFTIGIGSAPNRFFLEKAAQAGRGTSLSIMNMADVQNQMSSLLEKLEHPVLTQFDLQFEGGVGEYYPYPIPDLYHDQPLMLVARLDSKVTGFQLNAYQVDELWQQRFVTPAAGDSNVASIARHWARKKISNLSDDQRYAADQDKHQQEITQTALDFTLVSKYTSFVGVEQTPARPLSDTLDTAHVANLMPVGAAMESVLMPMGAAASDTLAWLSVLLAA